MVRRLTLLVLMAILLPLSAASQTPEAVRYLKYHAHPPADYILAKTRSHRVVLLGEAHWIRQDVELVIQLVPRLQEAGVDALALEVLPASEQASIDQILASGTWDRAAALRVLRIAAWPYREYLEILHAAWKHNRALPPGRKPLKLIALAPGTDWRERLLPKGDTYDRFMARLLLDFLKEPGRRVLVYAGRNHAFTRYYQPETPREQRVERFMDRMGNILWRELGEEVFLILLQSPWQCHVDKSGHWARCLPGGGAIDCAAATIHAPVGFDLIGSPLGELRVGREFAYSAGYPALRLLDISDGYIWAGPVEGLQGVELIPLAELAPDEVSLAEVARNNPFADRPGMGRGELQALWDEEAARLRDLGKSSGWEPLSTWRAMCQTSPH